MEYGIPDGLAAFFAVCFVSGFLLSLVSLALGQGDGHGDAHGIHADSADLTADAGHDAIGLPKHAGGHEHAGASALSFGTVTAFAMWFGGTGWALYGFLHLTPLLAVPVAMAAGLAGGTLIYLFLRRVLLPGQHVLNPADFQLPGAVGRALSEIRAGGSGEVVLEQGGTRRVVWARCDGDRSIPAGTEVVIDREQDGFVFVMPFAELVEAPAAALQAEPERPREQELS